MLGGMQHYALRGTLDLQAHLAEQLRHGGHVAQPRTLVRVSGFAVSSAAHMIGSAAFFAPEMRISPSSGGRP